jgi:hypothetical protein
LLAHGRWFSLGTPASSTTKTGRHDTAEIFLKVALNTINQSKSNHFLIYREECLHTSEQVVYSGSSTTSGQPCMTPRQLMDSMTQLEEMLRKLEQSIKEVVKDVEKKKQVLFYDIHCCFCLRVISI